MRRLAAVAVVVLAAGCGILQKGRFPNRRPQPPTFSQYHLAGWEWQGVDRVLVLPFLNESEHTRAGDEVRAAFTSELQRQGRWEVISAPPDDRAILATQIHRGGRFDEAAMLAIAKQTGADVIVHGIVTHYSPYPLPRIGLIFQAVGPQQAKVVASVDGLWDTTDPATAERCRIYYRQYSHPRPAFLRNNNLPIGDDNVFAPDVALQSPALFQRWVCHEAVLALQGLPVPGVISVSAGANTCAPATDGAPAAGQSAVGPVAPSVLEGKVK